MTAIVHLMLPPFVPDVTIHACSLAADSEQTLLQVEAVSSIMDVKPLRRLFDTISSHVRSLSAMNVQEDSYGTLLCPVLINKIPPELQLILSRKVSEEDWNLQTLMAAIEEEVIARERLGQSQPKAPVHKGHNKPPPTAVTFVTKGLPMHFCPKMLLL